MARDSTILDWRSTGRRKARRALFNARVEFRCIGYHDAKGIHHPCGKTTRTPPKDAPAFFEEIWPTEKRVLSSQSLQADHKDKDYENNALENLDWRCASCHKYSDQQTEKGISTVTINPADYL